MTTEAGAIFQMDLEMAEELGFQLCVGDKQSDTGELAGEIADAFSEWYSDEQAMSLLHEAASKGIDRALGVV